VAAIPARYALERGDWKQAEQLNPRKTPFPYTEAMTWFAWGLGAARLGQAKAAYESAMSLKQIHEQLLESGEIYWPLQVEIEELEVRAWAIWAEGDKQRALRQLESAAELEDGTEKNAVTPGPLAPGRELLGEMLLAANQPTHALEQFESTLKKEPGRFRALFGAGKAAQLARRYQLSRKYFGELLKVCERADRARRAE
jgi:tetratricopeptide (TPR) repeat protein